jgi:PPK2 family polyphosphate:nucleotide phosphotransferase
MKNLFKLTEYRVVGGRNFSLKHYPTRLAHDVDKDELKASVKKDAGRIGELQQLLYAEGSRALLLIFQAMDAAGKDSCIARVLREVSHQGCQVTSFKVPSKEELGHDFLWRHAKAAPAKGMIGVHNRSHYEEVLVVKVHPELLLEEHIPGIRSVQDVDPDLWGQRYGSIRAFEEHLARQGTSILKFYLHMGRQAQAKRLLERLEDPGKQWKFNLGDLKERAKWDAYMNAYGDAISATATPHAPWYVVPSDRQWETRAIVCRAVREHLEGMAPKPPALSPAGERDLRTGKAMLRAEQGSPKKSGRKVKR